MSRQHRIASALRRLVAHIDECDNVVLVSRDVRAAFAEAATRWLLGRETSTYLSQYLARLMEPPARLVPPAATTLAALHGVPRG